MHQYTSGSIVSPVAGADISYVLSNRDSVRLTTLRAKLVTSATVANRYGHFQFVDPSGDILHEVVAQAAQAAGATVTYDLVGGSGSMNEGSSIYDGLSSLPLPDLWFPPGTSIVTKTTGIQAGDQWSSIFFTALVGREWEHLELLAEIAQSMA